MARHWNWVLSLTLVLSVASADAEAVDFIRGDTNGDGSVTIADAVPLIGYFFWGIEATDCMLAGDFDDDETLSTSDFAGILQYVVGAGEPPSSPFPEPGPDPVRLHSSGKMTQSRLSPFR